MISKIIELDATKWKTVHHFYDALLSELSAPALHGHNINALVDSMIWGGMNKIEAPYLVKISNSTGLPKVVHQHIELLQSALFEARADFHARRGRDVVVELEFTS